MVRETGDASVLQVETDVPKPTCGPGEVVVKNEFAGINFIDTYHRSGLYKRNLPIVLGQEGGGVIDEVSEEAIKAGYKVGDRVAHMAFGSYGEYTTVSLSKLIPVPDDISIEVAIACMVQGLTAHYLVNSAHAGLIQRGEWCLIHSVGSGTCQWAAQMAKLQGYKVIGTSSKGKKDVAEKLGCDELILLDSAPGHSYSDYNSIDVVSKVMEITNNQGVKCVIDGVGKNTADISVKCLARQGIWISFGNASGAVPPFSLLSLTPKSAFVTRPKLGDYVATPEELKQRSSDVFEWVRQGKLSVTVDKIFTMDEARQSHEFIEGGHTKGKLLIRI
jgi:NADPH2:quinone reductase